MLPNPGNSDLPGSATPQANAGAWSPTSAMAAGRVTGGRDPPRQRRPP